MEFWQKVFLPNSRHPFFTVHCYSIDGLAVFFKVFMIFEYFPLIFFFDTNTIIYLLVGTVSVLLLCIPWFRLVIFNSFASYFFKYWHPFFPLCTVAVLTFLLSCSWFSNFGALYVKDATSLALDFLHVSILKIIFHLCPSI